ncbi:hypothetical protein HYDPIDRAFT_35039, partial [Hydnomerulius pinastri MD-312]
YAIFEKAPIGSTVQRIGPIPYDGEIFDGDGATLPYPTPDSPFLAVHAERAGTLAPPPVSTQFDAKWITQVIFKLVFAIGEISRFNLRKLCDQPSLLKLVTTRPLSIYYHREPSYPVIVPRGGSSPRQYFPDFRQFRAMHRDVITAVHTALSPQQSAECAQETLIGLAVEGPISTYFQVNRADFFQQRAPSANPFLTLEEAAYLRTASGYLRFYLQPDAADLLDDLLVCTVVDEDFAYTLLLDHHLDLLAIPHRPVSHLAERIHQANLIRQDCLEFDKLYEPSPIPLTLEPLRVLVRARTAAHPAKPGSGDIKPESVLGF